MSILNSASSESVHRGYEYYISDYVISNVQISEYEYEGYVKGTNKQPYHVVINTKHPKKSTCDCPFANGHTTCKHMVSLFFAISPGDLQDYEEWYENNYEEMYDEDDDYDKYYGGYYNDCSYNSNYYNHGKSKFVKPIFFDVILKSFVDNLSEQEAKKLLMEELNKSQEDTFNTYLEDVYNNYTKGKNSIYNILENLNKKIHKMSYEYDYNYNNYTIEFLNKKEKKIIFDEYIKNENIRDIVNNMFLKPEIAVYDDYKWFASLYKKQNKQNEIDEYIKKLESFLDTLKHYSIRNTHPKSNILIILCVLKGFNVEDKGKSLVDNCKYPEYVDYIIENEKNIKKLYKSFKESVEAQKYLDYENIVNTLYKIYLVNEDDEIYEQIEYYSFLKTKDIRYLRCLDLSPRFNYYIDKLLKTTKDMIVLEKVYIILDKKEELFKLLMDKGNESRIICNIEFLRDDYNNELLKYFKSKFYEIISLEKNRQGYHKACYYINAIYKLNNGNELVQEIINELKKSPEYCKRPALFQEIHMILKD